MGRKKKKRKRVYARLRNLGKCKNGEWCPHKKLTCVVEGKAVGWGGKSGLNGREKDGCN